MRTEAHMRTVATCGAEAESELREAAWRAKGSRPTLPATPSGRLGRSARGLLGHPCPRFTPAQRGLAPFARHAVASPAVRRLRLRILAPRNEWFGRCVRAQRSAGTSRGE